MTLTITATLSTFNEEKNQRVDIDKTFTAEMRSNGHLYCPEMIAWAKGHKDRISNLLWITYTTDRKHSSFWSI